VVVNDASTDKTIEILNNLNIYIINLPINLKYGGALQTGFKYAFRHNYDLVVTFDGDGQHRADQINLLLKAWGDTKADIVLGSRYINNYTDYNGSFLRRLGSKAFSWVIRLVTGKYITDPTSGFQLLTRPVFEYYSLAGRYPNEFPDANVLTLMLLKGHKVMETSVQMKKRVQGESMHSGLKPIRYIFLMLYSLGISILKRNI